MVNYKKGDRVFGISNNIWYPGKVSYIDKNGRINVEYDDGYSEWIEDLSFIQENCTFVQRKIPELKLGDRVIANWKHLNTWFSGKVSFIDEKGQVHISYDDGDSEWVEDLNRIQKIENLESDSHSNFQKGDRIMVHLKNTIRWYPGVIRVVYEGKINIELDNGYTEWIEDLSRIQKIEVLEPNLLSNFKEGDRIIGNFKNTNKWFPGVIRVITEDRINIEYDDGDSEWILDLSRIQKDKSNKSYTKEELYQ